MNNLLRWYIRSTELQRCASVHGERPIQSDKNQHFEEFFYGILLYRITITPPFLCQSSHFSTNDIWYLPMWLPMWSLWSTTHALAATSDRAGRGSSYGRAGTGWSHDRAMTMEPLPNDRCEDPFELSYVCCPRALLSGSLRSVVTHPRPGPAAFHPGAL